MTYVYRRGLTCLLLVCVSAPLAHAASAQWAQFREPLAGATTVEGGLPEGNFGLKVAWTQALGSGYSNVWVADGKAVTMFAAGAQDALAAFDVASGRELWRYPLADSYPAHDGADGGPVGTPTVHDGVVYALGPAGQLVALGLADGKKKWEQKLDEQNSTTPFYGYTTSPVVAGNLLIVATGGEGHAVTAFDRATGEPRWTAGSDTVAYQTPMLVDLGGRRQLLTVTNFMLMGIDPAKGTVLWQLRHTEEGGRAQESAHPTIVDARRFVVKYGDGTRLYRLAEGGPDEGVEEVWRSPAFGNTFALPVLVGDHLYGFTGNVMACASVETGEYAWRSRDIAGFGLSIEDGLLAVVSLDGELVLVDPSPEGYKEIARTPALEDGNYAVASFADGHFVVRNLSQLAAVKVDTSIKPPVASADAADRLLGDFGKWIASVEALAARERPAAVEQRLGSLEATPLVTGDGTTHFVWRGEAQDVAIAGSFDTNGRELPLYRVEGTDLFFRSMQLDPKGEYTYNLVVDFENRVQDPRNPLTVDNGFSVASELRMPQWPASPHIDAPAADAPRGSLDVFQFRSEILENTREIQLWRPADYASDQDRRYPVLVVNHGDNLLRGSLMRNSLDNLVGKSVAPLIAVFVPRTAPPEYGGPAADNYTRFLVEELLPHIDRHYRTDPAQRAIMGPGSAGVAAIYSAFQRPDVFRKAATQSFYPIDHAQAQLPDLMSKADPKPELVYVVWSNHDYDLGDGRKADEASRALVGTLREIGVGVKEQVSDYTPGWGGWRGQHDEILSALFPLTQ